MMNLQENEKFWLNDSLSKCFMKHAWSIYTQQQQQLINLILLTTIQIFTYTQHV